MVVGYWVGWPAISSQKTLRVEFDFPTYAGTIRMTLVGLATLLAPAPSVVRTAWARTPNLACTAVREDAACSAALLR
jgi:hypothetical protein